jgi:hypothetical protein
MAQQNNNNDIQFIDDEYYEIKNIFNKNGEMVLYYPAESITYIYELDKLDNYNNLHKGAEYVLSKNRKFLGGYDMLLYKICKGNIELIKKLYKEVKTINSNLKDFYEKLRNKYDVKDITDSHFDCMKFNPFKIIVEYNEEDKEKEEQSREFKKRCDVIEKYLEHKGFCEYLGNYKFDL